MLDASKVFDSINVWLLFQKLLSRYGQLFIVRIVVMRYSHQKMCIRWGNAISPSFTVSNGMKQGCIISPILFNVHIDGLSVLLYDYDYDYDYDITLFEHKQNQHKLIIIVQ